jgi:hypothetical protein
LHFFGHSKPSLDKTDHADDFTAGELLILWLLLLQKRFHTPGTLTFAAIFDRALPYKFRIFRSQR